MEHLENLKAKVGAIALVVLLVLPISQSARLLLLPAQELHSDSHFFCILGAELKARGHDVTVVANDQTGFIIERSGLELQTYVTSTEQDNIVKKMSSVRQKMVFSPGGDMMSVFQRSSVIHTEICREMFLDVKFMNRLKKAEYDLAIVDGIDYARCLYLIPYKLNLKYVTLTSRHDPWLAGVPSLPSLEPFFANLDTPESLTFLSRLRNAAMFIGSYVFLSSMADDKLIFQFAPERPASSFSQLYSKSDIFLVNIDTNCLEPPLISSPHYQYISGLTLAPIKPLPENLREFLDGSQEAGAILISFGSLSTHLPESFVKVLFGTFGKIFQRVILKDVGQRTADTQKLISPNVLIESWLPQNDIMGHPKTKLFITHAGNSGQQEAVSHGVPMINIPIFGDQFHNAKRVEKRGFGRTLSWRTVTTKQLVSTIEDILRNESYTVNIKQCSKLLKSLESPRQKAVRLIEHVMEFGSSHLSPWMGNMSIFQVFMVDLVLAILVGTIVFLCGFWWSCKSLCRKCKNFKVDEEEYLAKRAERRKRISHHRHQIKRD